VPADKLIAAMTAAVKADGGVDNFRPVRDGGTLPTHPFFPAAPALSAQIPLMIGTAQNEAAFYMASDMANFAMTREQAVARAGKFVGVDAASAERLFAAYEASHPGANASQVYIAIHSDQMYRRNDIRAAELRAAQGKAPTFMYWFTWKTPVMNGVLGTPHTLEVPFAFHNVDLVPELCGSGPEQNALQDRVMGAWVAFARHGKPDHAGLPHWTPYTAAGRETMIFDNQCKVVADPGKADRETIAQYPAYEPESLGRRT
jgi:para-nitrobenzyl esterase